MEYLEVDIWRNVSVNYRVKLVLKKIEVLDLYVIKIKESESKIVVNK